MKFQILFSGKNRKTNNLSSELAKSVVKVKVQGPDVQSIIRLTSSLVVKILTVLVSTISNSQVFLLKKCE